MFEDFKEFVLTVIVIVVACVIVILSMTIPTIINTKINANKEITLKQIEVYSKEVKSEKNK